MCVCVCVSTEAKTYQRLMVQKALLIRTRIQILSVLKKNLTITSDSIYEDFYDTIIVSKSLKYDITLEIYLNPRVILIKQFLWKNIMYEEY